MAFSTFEENFLLPSSPYPAGGQWPEWLPKQPYDIVNFLGKYGEKLRSLRGKVDLVCGGPPCQGFSISGSRKEFDQRNKLPEFFIQFVEECLPTFVLLENVEGIRKKFNTTDESSYVDFIEKSLRATGYRTSHHVLDASRFGVPQTRKRVFVFGIKETVAKTSNIDPNSIFDYMERDRGEFLAKIGLGKNPITAEEAIGDLSGDNFIPCPDSPKFETCTYETATSQYSKLIREGFRKGNIPDSH